MIAKYWEQINAQRQRINELWYVHYTEYNIATKIHIVGMEMYSQYIK